MNIDIPGVVEIIIKTIILDLNGTLAVGGVLVPGVEERIMKLKELGYKLVLFSGDTRGNAGELAQRTGIELVLIKNAQDKLTETLKRDPETCASIGNGLIDLLMMQAVKLAILTLQAEGVHTKTLMESDIVVPNVIDALDIFIDPQRLIASLRT